MTGRPTRRCCRTRTATIPLPGRARRRSCELFEARSLRDRLAPSTRESSVMHKRTFLLLLPLATLISFAAPPRPGPQEKKETELQKQMEVIDKGMNKLKSSLKDAAKNAESLATLIEMQKAAQASKTETPKMTTSLPEADRAKFVTSYRKQIIALQQKLLELETVLLDNDSAKAEQVYRALKVLEENGHEQFTNE